MYRLREIGGRIATGMLLAVIAACSDQPLAPIHPSTEAAPARSVGSGRTPRDVPAVRIDLPPAPRPWDRDPGALAQAISTGDGYAVVAIKEPGSRHALATGRRAAVTAGTVTAALQLLSQHGVQVLEVLDGIGAARVRIAPEVAVELASHPLVDFIEPRQYGKVMAQTTPWGISMVRAPEAWSLTTGTGAKVLIIDTGHEQGHPDLPYVPSTNCAGVYGGCDDGSGAGWHGTHVLGIVTARDNTIGVVGVAPGIAASDVYMYGACDSTYGSCPTDEVTAGINSGIFTTHVMNLSLSGPYDAAQASAVAQAWNNGIVIVAAAGNDLSNTTVYPAGYTNVLGVSGVRSDKSFASTSICGNYSNYGYHVDIAAPFEAYSTIGGSSYGTLCGTSMASPHVAGAAALIRAKYPTWTNQDIVNQLLNTAEDGGAAGYDVYFGYGIVDVAKALGITPTPPPGQPSANISGPDYLFYGDVGTWYANASGGNGTYTYQWQYRASGGTTWSNVGTGSSYTRTAGRVSFDLRVIVTSAGVSTTSAPYSVYVEPSDPMCGNYLC